MFEGNIGSIQISPLVLCALFVILCLPMEIRNESFVNAHLIITTLVFSLSAMDGHTS